MNATPPPQIVRQRRTALRKVMIGKREVLTSGIAPNIWNDVYFSAMTLGWPAFLGGLAIAFVVINAVFAIFYALVPNCIANSQGRLLQLFFFSVETLTTVGYGEMFPQTDYAHALVSVETFVGLFFTASMLGLIFARVSRPRARMMFARNLTVGPHEGQPTLSVRVANARLNVIASATARLWLLITETTAEKASFRRFQELKLLRSENPTFALSWMILHVIDAASPLYGSTAESLRASDALFILTIEGHDETSAQTLKARETYSVEDLRWDHRFVDVLTVLADGTSVLNYERFHDVEPLPG